MRRLTDDITVRPVDMWPGIPTTRPRRAPFTAGWSSTVATLGTELHAIDARHVVLLAYLTESQIRLDGWIRADATPTSPGVILAFDSRYGPLKYACDAFSHWKDNMRAIALGLEALRRVDRYGISKRGEQYTGYRALPGGNVSTVGGTYTLTIDGAWRIIAEAINATVDIARVADWSQVRVKALRAAHPDTGGDGETFIRVQGAVAMVERARR